MGKANNLGDFMTDLADAIREKTGATEPINPQDFSDTIKGIQSGGGVVAPNDVNFYDHDGKILHSYSASKFLAMTEMPPLPTREGLICQGWNWELEVAKSQVTESGKCDIGATYITDDGKTRLYIRIAAEGRMDVPLYFSQSSKYPVVIDWGDGSDTQTLTGSDMLTARHQYANVGDYCITMDVPEGGVLSLGHASTSGSVIGTTHNEEKVYCNMLLKAEIGRGVTSINAYTFLHCYSLASITIPQDVTSIANNAFDYCYSLASITIPQGVASIGKETFRNCYSLASITIPHSVAKLYANVFDNCYALASVVIPNGVTSIGNYSFRNCSSLTSITISQGMTSISSYAFTKCYALASVVIPNGVTSIGIDAFASCYALASITIPQGVVALESGVCEKCYALASIAIPQGVTEISSDLFYYCYALASVTIPQGVTSVGAYAFQYCTSLASIDFSALTSVPTLNNTNAFSYIASDCKIIVPDALYDEWIAATNWSTSSISSKIIKKSDWDAQNA